MISTKKRFSWLLLPVLASLASCSGDELGAEEPLGEHQEALTTICPFRQTSSAAPVTFAGSRIRALLVHGSRVYIGGTFSFSWNGQTYRNLAAFDLPANPAATPTVVTGFRPQPDEQVWSLAADGTKLYVGGEFSTLAGATRTRLGAVNVNTGAIDGTFTANVSGGVGIVRALAFTSDGTSLVVGGNFTTIKSQSRLSIAAVDKTSGNVSSTRFTSGASGGTVMSMVSRPGFAYMFVGGDFTNYQGHANLVAANSSGTAGPGVFETYANPVLSLSLDPTAAGQVFAALGGSANRVYSLVATGFSQGALLWQTNGVQGDVQAVHYHDGGVYFGFHDGMFVNGSVQAPGDQYKMAAVSSTPPLTNGFAPFMFHSSTPGGPCTSANPNGCWAPKTDPTNGFFGVWAITSYVPPNGSPRLMAGGEFTRMSTVVSPTKFFASFERLY